MVLERHTERERRGERKRGRETEEREREIDKRGMGNYDIRIYKQ